MNKVKHIMLLLSCFLGICLSAEAEPAHKKGSSASKSPNYQSIPEANLLKSFNGYLRDRLGKEGSDLIVSRFKVNDNKPVPSGELGLRLYQNEKKSLQGYVRLIAVVSVNGVVKNKVKLSGWVDVFESVVCAYRNLKKGEVIREDDIYLARTNISRQPPNILTDLKKAVGLMAKNSIRADTSIKEWMLGKSPMVNKGDLVTILAESNGLKVTVPGRILETGYEGKLVRVQNTMSNKQITARVENHSTVTVDF